MQRLRAVALLAAATAAAGAGGTSFTLLRSRNVDWLRTPGGRLFFSNGVDVVDDAKAAPQLRRWGFNTIGAWSRDELEHSGMPFTVELHLGGMQGFPWCDFFSEKFATGVQDAARAAGARYGGNAQLIGYFSDNEIGWWGPTIFQFHLQQPPNSATRKALFAALRTHYANDFSRLQVDWETPDADTWEALEAGNGRRMWLRPGRRGMEAVHAFLEVAADRYYAVTTDAMRKADPASLEFGDRYAGYFDGAVAAAAGRHLDVVSTNYGAEFGDGSLSHFYMESLHRATGRPLMVTEYYVAANENRTGNKNPGDVFLTVQTQGERARAFARNLRELSSIPYNVGAHWFQYRDEPAGGRAGDGEDYNMGLVSMDGEPYRELTAAAAGMDVTNLHRNGAAVAAKRRRVSFPQDPWSGLTAWPRAEAWLRPEDPLTFGDLYVMRHDGALWLGLLYMDYMDPKLYRSAEEADRDCAKLRVRSDSGQEIEVTVPAKGGPDVTRGTGTEARVWRHGTRVTLIVRLPATRRLAVSFRSAGGGWQGAWKWARSQPQ